MNKITFVILHFKDYNVTYNAINLLLKQKYNSYEIIVLDNYSNNGSFEKLCESFKNDDRLYFVGIEYNLGFAKSNDLGYQIAKHKFNSDIIVVMNNDIMIEDFDFCNKLNKYSDNSNFMIMGPDIITKDGIHQNPLPIVIDSINTINKMIIKARIKIFLLKILPKYSTKKINISGDYENYKENVPLHGSCIIFGKKFIKNHEYPFYPDTFLYGEEDILYNLNKEKNGSLIYNPNLMVKHLEDVSTSNIVKTPKDKRLFELKNMIESLKVLKKVLKR